MTRSCLFIDPRGKQRCTECAEFEDQCVCENPNVRANLRLTSSQGQFLTAVLTQLETTKLEQSYLFERLVQIVGEIGSKLVSHNSNRTPAPSEIYQEIIHLVVLSTILATEGTGEFSYPEV